MWFLAQMSAAPVRSEMTCGGADTAVTDGRVAIGDRGWLSSSLMVAVADGIEPRFAFVDGFDSVRANTSSDSTTASSITVTDTTADVAPAGIVTRRLTDP